MFARLHPLRPWRFNSVLLAEDRYKQFVHSQINMFFELNDLPDTGRGLLWEASKAYVRGHFISFISNAKKVENSQTARLLRDIKAIDERYAINLNPSLYGEHLKLQTEFDFISTTRVNTLLLKSKQHFYESGDKAGKLLAHQATAEATSRLIQEVKAATREVLSDPKLINNTFAEFYTSGFTVEY